MAEILNLGNGVAYFPHPAFQSDPEPIAADIYIGIGCQTELFSFDYAKLLLGDTHKGNNVSCRYGQKHPALVCPEESIKVFVLRGSVGDSPVPVPCTQWWQHILRKPARMTIHELNTGTCKPKCWATRFLST